jgi:hemoglobin
VESAGSVFDLVGGQPWFDALVERFYDGVVGDAGLRPMYPDDLTDSKRHLAQFLAQYWGGPTTYSDQRGHPRLRMRHMPFSIHKAERDAWYSHMAAAVRSGGLSEEVEEAMLGYFDNAATHLINATG